MATAASIVKVLTYEPLQHWQLMLTEQKFGHCVSVPSHLTPVRVVCAVARAYPNRFNSPPVQVALPLGLRVALDEPAGILPSRLPRLLESGPLIVGPEREEESEDPVA